MVAIADLFATVLEWTGTNPGGQLYDSRSLLSLGRWRIVTRWTRLGDGEIQDNARQKRYRLYADGRFFDTLSDPTEAFPISPATQNEIDRYNGLRDVLISDGLWTGA